MSGKTQNAKLKQKITEMTEVKKPKKQTIKPVIKKSEPVVEEIKPQIKDTIIQWWT